MTQVVNTYTASPFCQWNKSYCSPHYSLGFPSSFIILNSSCIFSSSLYQFSYLIVSRISTTKYVTSTLSSNLYESSTYSPQKICKIEWSIFHLFLLSLKYMYLCYKMIIDEDFIPGSVKIDKLKSSTYFYMYRSRLFYGPLA